MANNWVLSPLGKNHDRGAFDCGIEVLNNFLKTLASQHQEKGFSRTIVATNDGGIEVKGYYALSSGNVDLSLLPEKDRKRLPKHPVPVVHLGRLAVCKSVQGKGLGEFLLMDALNKALQVKEKIGVYAMEVVCINENAIKFYTGYGFQTLNDDTKHLYLPMKTIETLKNITQHT